MFAQKDRELLCIFCKDESIVCDRAARGGRLSQAAQKRRPEALVARSRLRKTSPDEGFPAVAIFTKRPDPQ